MFLKEMTMLKQSPSKNIRSKGFKVKHVLQVCLLLAICFWLLHQVKHSYDKKTAYEEGNATPSEVLSDHESIKLGRKDIRFPIQQTTLEMDRRDGGEFRVKADEKEKNKPEESKDEGRGGGDDNIDGSDQEKSEEEESEEVEDLIDEEDRETEDETEEVENQFEDESLLENQVQYEGQGNSVARERGVLQG